MEKKTLIFRYFPPQFIQMVLVLGILVGGYIYNYKFIQQGLPDLAKNVLHMESIIFSFWMAILAIITTVIAIAFGFLLEKHPVGLKMRLDFFLVIGIAQTLLTYWAGCLTNADIFPLWIIFTSISLGAGIAISFPLFYLLIPTKYRGLMAGLIAGLAYLIGNVDPFDWTIYGLRDEALFFLLPGLVLLFAFRVLGISKILESSLPEINPRSDNENKELNVYNGRFEKTPFVPVLFVMFFVFFIDSLGFLRLGENTILFNQTWRGPLETRIILGIAHFFGGILGGILYDKSNAFTLAIASLIGILIADIIFLMIPIDHAGGILFAAILYCIAVSIYTVNNFAVWADISNSKNYIRNASIGIGIGGWLSSFLSTMVVFLLMDLISFELHLLFTAILGVIFLIITYFSVKRN